MATIDEQQFGVHSEVGQLRKVMVCAPGRAHQRLTPSNCDALLFDDVMWVENAKRDHFDFVQKMRDRGDRRGRDAQPAGRDGGDPRGQEMDPRQPGGAEPGRASASSTRSRATSTASTPRELAETLIGGLSTDEFPETHGGETLKLVRDAAGVTEYLLPPLPNTLYTRDTTCWIYGGVTLNPLYWPARHEENDPHDGDLQVPPGLRRQGQRLVGRPDEDHGLATLEGGDVMPIGKGNVLIGMSERTSRQAISQVAAALFKRARPSG